MTLFEVRQRSTGIVLWVGPATDMDNALDAMAREAGYRDAVHLPLHIRNGGFRTCALRP